MSTSVEQTKANRASRVGLWTHEDCLTHRPPAGHPESPARLKAVLAALNTDEFRDLVRYQAPEASLENITYVHPLAHIEGLEAKVTRASQVGQAIPLDPDTWASVDSLKAARRAAGAVVAAVDAVLSGQLDTAFCAVRPPGHHAEPDKAMGFCLWNNVAIGALHARIAHGIERVAVIDFDVHHGNGSQTLAEADANFFYGSIHQGGIYPGSGFDEETGADHNLVNIPVPADCGSTAWRVAFQSRLLTALERWYPGIILVSAGFDAHAQDPLAGLNLHEDDYYWATEQLCALAARLQVKLVSALEGGYHLQALALCAQQHVRALMAVEYAQGAR